MIGNVSSKILGFFLLPVYTHYLSQSVLGTFDLIFSTISIIIPVVTLSSINSIFRYALDSEDKKDLSEIFSNGVFILSAGMLISMIPYLAFSIITRQSNTILITVLVITTIFNSAWQQIARALKENLVYAVSGTLFSIILFISTILFLLLGLHLEALLLSYIVSPLISFLYIEYKVKILRRLYFKTINKEKIKSMLKYSIPLMPNDISWWIMTTSNRFIITAFLGISANGIFSIANKFPSLLSMLNNIFNQAWTESAITEYNSKDKDVFYTNVFNVLARLQFSAFLILLPVMRYIVKLMVQKSFVSAWEYIPFLMLGTIFSSFSIFYGTGYLSSKKTKGAFITTIISSVVNVAINILLIKRLGLQSAALANFLSFFILWLIRMVQMKKYFKISLDYKMILINLIMVSVYIACYYQQLLWLDISMLCVALAAGFYWNGKMIGKLLKIKR